MADLLLVDSAKSIPAPRTAPPTRGISAIVTAYQRVEQTLLTLSKLRACDPPPAEILVHIDGNQTACEEAVKKAWPDIHLIRSETNVGPGGGRNKLVAAAAHPLVASFDDDSYPVDADFFARVEKVAGDFPEASVIAGSVYHRAEKILPDKPTARWMADYGGGACIFRREAFLQTHGYVPLPVAYGMEEVDLALRLHAAGRRILQTPWLRVFHDTDLGRHADPRVTAASIANLVLLPYLRYPPVLWPRGAAQFLNRIAWLMRHGRSRGILHGIASIPALLRENKSYKMRLPAEAVRSYLALRRSPLPAPWIRSGEPGGSVPQGLD